jgi:hypothetical protein
LDVWRHVACPVLAASAPEMPKMPHMPERQKGDSIEDGGGVWGGAAPQEKQGWLGGRSPPKHFGGLSGA